MAKVLRYRALDEDGERILDRLERHLEFTPVRLIDGTRSYLLLDISVDAVDAKLTEIDAAWGRHLEAVPPTHRLA